MRKLISFAVPSYNSQDYLSNCVESLLKGGDEIEIIIINDGSTDRTAEIANEYQERYPGIVRAVHKENAGHGSGVNRGIVEATGIYYKVVDSDDWVDEKALKTLLSTIRLHLKENALPDMYITNFVYERAYDNTRRVMDYGKFFPEGKLITWDEVRKFTPARVLLMHAVIYKTDILKEHNVQVPERTFYVDNVFVYSPLPLMKTIYYLNVDLYRYFIGRKDQSIHIDNFVKRYRDQIRCMTAMVKSHSFAEMKQMPKPLRKYLLHTLGTIMLNTLLFTGAVYSKERKEDLKNFWRDIKQFDKKLYRFIRYRSYPAIVQWLPWRIRGFVLKKGYFIVAKIYKLG